RDDLLLRLHRTRSGDDGDLAAAKGDAGSERDDGIRLLPLARDLLVRFADVNDFGHAGQRLDPRSVDRPVIADQSDGHALLARHGTRAVTHLLYGFHDAVDLLPRRVILHDDQHYASSISMAQPSCASTTGPA